MIILVSIIIILNSLVMIFKINRTFKFSTAELVFCPVFGSTDRCDFIHLINTISIVSCIILIPETLGLNVHNYPIRLLKKNTIFLLKIQIILWLLSFLLFFYWTGEVESENFERFKNICYVAVNLGSLFALYFKFKK